MSKTANRTPLAEVFCTGIVRGHRRLKATYPSATSAAIWALEFMDDGAVLQCSCPGWQNHGRCWHMFDVDNAIPEHFRQEHAGDNPDLLAAYISSLELHLTHPLDESERAAGDFELIGLRMAERELAERRAA